MDWAIRKSCNVVRGVRKSHNPTTNPATTRPIPAAILTLGVSFIPSSLEITLGDQSVDEKTKSSHCGDQRQP